ncbi:hypothetical protein EVAR_36562_1 [Eumeta japonica]|uniref:Uncharacterized protein n=1 Tax=Eumeta variegata TaxID=151549 RepID=A0A4C1XZZ1_EUMVA|nr:hypothetical protein EVAR_36562_1 [Eumeta japonica]
MAKRHECADPCNGLASRLPFTGLHVACTLFMMSILKSTLFLVLDYEGLKNRYDWELLTTQPEVLCVTRSV